MYWLGRPCCGSWGQVVFDFSHASVALIWYHLPVLYQLGVTLGTPNTHAKLKKTIPRWTNQTLINKPGRVNGIFRSDWNTPEFIHPSLWLVLSGSRFNIKMSSYRYRKSQCGDKTVVRSSYLHNGISYTGKMTSLYWFSPLGFKNSDCYVTFYINCWREHHLVHGKRKSVFGINMYWFIANNIHLLQSQAGMPILLSLSDAFFLWRLTHWCLVMPYGIIDLGQYCFG